MLKIVCNNYNLNALQSIQKHLLSFSSSKMCKLHKHPVNDAELRWYIEYRVGIKNFCGLHFFLNGQVGKLLFFEKRFMFGVWGLFSRLTVLWFRNIEVFVEAGKAHNSQTKYVPSPVKENDKSAFLAVLCYITTQSRGPPLGCLFSFRFTLLIFIRVDLDLALTTLLYQIK